ncbi:MAG TPA: VWA domain-containing protein [Thermoanaerobaculia bacterium]|nr:VWA domain-containing protein [Thermoanaerobaculia bacterium]
MSKLPVFAVTVVAIAAAAALRAGSREPGAVHETAEVTLVQVPVNVTGRDGKPIRNLTEKDFTLEDDGHRQKVLAVDTLDFSRRNRVSGLPSDLPVAGRRHFLLLFDFSFATPNEIARSRQAALAFVRTGMGPDDLTSIATQSVEQGVQLLLNFTNDRRQLEAAVQRVGLPLLTDHMRDPLAFAFVLPGDPNAAKLTPAEQYRDSSAGEMAASAKIFSMLAQKTADRFAEGRVARQLGGIGGLGHALDVVEGRKLVIYFSEGFDSSLLYGNILRSGEDNQADNDAMSAGQLWSVDLDKRYNNTALERRLADTMEIYRRSDCAIYPVDIAGLRDSSDASLGTRVSYGRESLFAIASATGGEVIENSNDLESQLQRIVEKTSFVYVLSYRPSHPGKPGQFHELKVKVDAPHARVSARAGYYDSRSFGALSPLERVFSAADVINDGRTPGKIPLHVAALPMAGKSLNPVPVIVSVPPAFFAKLPADGDMRVGIYGYVSDERGALADYFSRSVTIELGKLRNALGAGGFTYLTTCHLVPGNYRLRVLFRNETSGDYGFSQSDLPVTELATGGFEVLPPVFVDGAGDGVNIRDAAANAPSDGIFTIGDRAFAPRVSPDLAPNSTARLCLVVIQNESGSGMMPFTMDAELVPGDGGARVPAKVRLLGRTPLAADGMWKLVLELDTSGLRAGRWSLRLGVRADGVPATETEAAFTVS